MRISRVGYTRCPGCLCHVKVVAGATECPFCGEELRDADTIGRGAMEKLRSSRAAFIAMGLAGGLTFAVACGDPEPKPDPTNNTNIDPGNDYGGFDPDAGQVEQDMGSTEEDSGFVDPGTDYGGFDPDGGF